MTDIRLKENFTLQGVTMDWLLRDTGLIDERDELATSVKVALGTDSQAAASDILPDPDSVDRKGWWGDLDADEIWGGWPIGCKNWLLTRAKILTATPSLEGDTLERARQYTREALQPFVDQRMATQIVVGATRTGLERIEVTALLFRGNLVEIDLRFQILWTEDPIYPA